MPIRINEALDDDREDANPDGHGGDLGKQQGDKCSGDEEPEHSCFSSGEKRTAPMLCVAKVDARSVATFSGCRAHSIAEGSCHNPTASC